METVVSSEREMLTHKASLLCCLLWFKFDCVRWVEPKGSCLPGEAEVAALGDVVCAKCRSFVVKTRLG